MLVKRALVFIAVASPKLSALEDAVVVDSHEESPVFEVAAPCSVLDPQTPHAGVTSPAPIDERALPMVQATQVVAFVAVAFAPINVESFAVSYPRKMIANNNNKTATTTTTTTTGKSVPEQRSRQ